MDPAVSRKRRRVYFIRAILHIPRGGDMRFWLLLVSALAVGTLAGAQSSDSSVVHVDPEKVAAALAKGGVLVTRPDLLVQGSHREAAGQVEVHDKETDVLYIIDGEARFAYGGRMVGGTASRPGPRLATG